MKKTMRTADSGGGNGFTLIEVLVTLVIVSMFSSAVYAVFLRSVVDARSVEESTMAWRAGQSILKLLEQDLTACVAASDEVPHFTGTLTVSEASRLAFLTATSSRLAVNGEAADVIRVSYEAVSDDSEEGLFRLYRKEEPSGGRSLGEGGEYQLLVDRVKRFELEYLDGMTWQNTWDGPSLPRAVRMNLVLQKDIQAAAGGPVRGREFSFPAVVAIPAGE